MATNMAVIQRCWRLGDSATPSTLGTSLSPRGGVSASLPPHRGSTVPSVPRSDCAILYNDRSVLENHHISAVFRMMQDDEMNIFVNLTKDEFA